MKTCTRFQTDKHSAYWDIAKNDTKDESENKTEEMMTNPGRKLSYKLKRTYVEAFSTPTEFQDDEELPDLTLDDLNFSDLSF